MAGLAGSGGHFYGPPGGPIPCPIVPGPGLKAGVDEPELGCGYLVGALVFLTGASFFSSGSIVCF